MRRRLTARVRNRIDLLRADIRRRRAGTHLLEEMGGHPEQIRGLPDPAQDLEFAAIAEDLLDDDDLVDAIEETGWTR